MHVYHTTQQNNILNALLLGVLWNVTLVLNAKALVDVVGFGHLALALIALVLALEFAVWLRLHYDMNPIRGHDVCNILTGRPSWCLLVAIIVISLTYLLLEQAAPLP